MKGFAACSILAALLLVGAGCNGSGEATGVVQLAAASQPSSSDSTPSDPAPAGDTFLKLTVKQVDFHVAARDDGDASDGSGDDGETHGQPSGTDEDPDDGGWVTMAFGQAIDLREGANRITLGSAVVPAGRLTQIRLVLDGDAVLTTGDVHTDIACPSCTTSGLKLLVDDDVEIPAGGSVKLTLVFDLAGTALQAAAGSKLGPVVHVDASLAP